MDFSMTDFDSMDLDSMVTSLHTIANASIPHISKPSERPPKNRRRGRVHFRMHVDAVQSDRVHRTNKPYAGRPERRKVDANGMPIDGPVPQSRSGRPLPTAAQIKRLPAGTPPILKGDAAQRLKEKKASQSKLSEMLRSEEMKQWLRSRLIEEGVLNMSVSGPHVLESRRLLVVTTNGSMAQGAWYPTPWTSRRPRNLWSCILETHR
jgi:hypothetical protein